MGRDGEPVRLDTGTPFLALIVRIVNGRVVVASKSLPGRIS